MKALLLTTVRLFPRAFRSEFGAEVVAQALSDYARARARGRAAGAWLAVATIFNISCAALAEHARPTWNNLSPSPHKGLSMLRILDQWRLDLTYAGRALRRSPGFAAVTVLTLALAIGVTAGIFSVVNTVLIQPLPFAAPERLVYIASTAPGSDFPPEFGVSQEFVLHYRERATLLEDVALVQSFTSTIRVGDRVERVRMGSGTPSLFTTLGARTVLGRLPLPSDGSEAAVISHTLWQTWFGGRDDVIGQEHFMGGSNRRIVGVMPPEFRYPTHDTLLWLSNDVRPAGLVTGRFGAGMVARMKPGAGTDDVTRELTSLAKELPGRFGGTAGYARLMNQYVAVVTPLADQVVGTAARPLWVLLAAAGLVLLIACANVANLFMVRAEGRHREMAVRQAIGAQRGELLRVQLSEVLLVAMAAGAAAIVFAKVTLPVFLRMAPPGLPRVSEIHVDALTVVFTAGLAVLAGLACGMFPALRGSRPNLARLRDGSRGSTRGRLWVRNSLVVAQTALALVLLTASGLLLRSHAKLSAVDPGYDVRDVFTFQIAPEQPSLVDGPTYAQFWHTFMDRIQALPGVQTVGIVENVPLDEGLAASRFKTDNASGEAAPLINFTFAGGDYYKAMGIDVIAGRAFTREDAVSSLGHVVISRTAARMLWPDQDPVGRRLQREGLTTWETVIGVVDDVIQDDYREAGAPLVYFPLTGQLPTQWRLGSPAFVVKTARADSIAADIRAIVRDIAPEAPMYRAYTMEGLAERSMLPLAFTMMTLATVSTLALILGAIGLYGVLSYVVSERTREIGVRMALGAQVSGVRRMVVAEGAKVIGLGVVIGLAIAAFATQALGALLFGVEARDLPVFAGTTVAITLIGLVASYLPARRASNVDPLECLRRE